LGDEAPGILKEIRDSKLTLGTQSVSALIKGVGNAIAGQNDLTLQDTIYCIAKANA
jgi:hypothetical protein